MFNEQNNKILKKITDEYTVPHDVEPVLEILKKHVERIRFVKDHNGVKNLVFITTTPVDSYIFEVPYFLITTRNKGTNAYSYETKVSYTPKDIISELEKFFESTKETMYVAIGFSENEVTKLDYMEMLNIMENTKCNIVDAFVTLRRFPEWYNLKAELPIYIFKEQEYLKQFETFERQFLLAKKQEILNKLHTVVEENNELEFEKLSLYIKNINHQLSEYHK